MSKKEFVANIKENLDKEFDGACNSYSIFYVFGADRNEVENALVELGEDFVSGYDSGIDGVFAFVCWKMGTYFANDLSEKLPDKLVVGETSWDYFDVTVSKNGKEAVKEKDYLFYMEYEANESEWGCSDTMYSFTDTKTGCSVKSGSGMVLDEYVKEVIRLTTSKKHGIDWDYWHEKDSFDRE